MWGRATTTTVTSSATMNAAALRLSSATHCLGVQAGGGSVFGCKLVLRARLEVTRFMPFVQLAR
jgi:hypothetical protein